MVNSLDSEIGNPLDSSEIEILVIWNHILYTIVLAFRDSLIYFPLFQS